MPKPAIESAIEAIRNFDNTGIGILEISHRTPGAGNALWQKQSNSGDLLNIPEKEYAVLFLGGGASTQFFYGKLICRQKSRLSANRRMGKESHQGSKILR